MINISNTLDPNTIFSPFSILSEKVWLVFFFMCSFLWSSALLDIILENIDILISLWLLYMSFSNIDWWSSFGSSRQNWVGTVGVFVLYWTFLNDLEHHTLTIKYFKALGIIILGTVLICGSLWTQQWCTCGLKWDTWHIHCLISQDTCFITSDGHAF